MGYAGRYLRKYGKQVTVNREDPVTAYVSLKRSTKAIYSPAARDSMFDGLIEASSGLVSGETFSIGSDVFLTQTADEDPASKEIIIFVVKTNTVVSILRQEETADENFNILKEWKTLKTGIPCYMEVITRTLRQYDAGLLDNAIYTMQISKLMNIKEMDRIKVEGDNKSYKVESIDNCGLGGVLRIQLSKDTRP